MMPRSLVIKTSFRFQFSAIFYKKRRGPLFLAAAASLLSPPVAFASVFSVEEYLQEVRSGNEGIRAASETSAGARQRAEEANLIFSPQWSATAQVLSDARPQLNSFAPQKTDATGLQLALAQQLPFGGQARLGYQLAHVQLDVLNPAFFNTTNYFDAIPSFDLSLPLWRNWGGRESKSQKTLAQASALATHYGERFRARMLLLEAELAYWRLALGREVVQVQKKTLERTQYLREWAERRFRLNLSDRSDFLQAKAATRFRELELRAAQDEERAASQAFNSLRGQAPEALVGALAPLSASKMDIPDTWKTLDGPPRDR
ncbi:MAG: hypothetical protein RJB38_1092, partial [Pseudomonadota bacterium]